MVFDDDDDAAMPDEIEPMAPLACNALSHHTAYQLLDGFERLCREHALLLAAAERARRNVPTGFLDEVATALNDTHETLLALLTGHSLSLPASIHVQPKHLP